SHYVTLATLSHTSLPRRSSDLLGQSRQIVDVDVALPVAALGREQRECGQRHERVGDEVEDERRRARGDSGRHRDQDVAGMRHGRSEEHTSELQSLAYLVCRLLL